MAINRLTRDQICLKALDLADSAVLDQKDRPAGTIAASAFSVEWLQEALDYFNKKWPWSLNIKQTTLTIPLVVPPNVFYQSLTLPTDFVLDYTSGVILANDEGRLVRRSLATVISKSITAVARPQFYAIQGTNIFLWPASEKVRTATLFYYNLPPVLNPTDIPSFPDDFVLVNYVWLKAQEWLRAAPPGAALKYADDRIVELQKAGLGAEAEDDQLGLDPLWASQPLGDPLSWMGKTAL